MKNQKIIITSIYKIFRMTELMSGFWVSGNDNITKFFVTEVTENPVKKVHFYIRSFSRSLAIGLGSGKNQAFEFTINPEQFEHFKNNVLDTNGNVWFIDEIRIVPRKWTSSEPKPQPNKDESNIERYENSKHAAAIRINEFLGNATVYYTHEMNHAHNNQHLHDKYISEKKAFEKCLKLIVRLKESFNAAPDARATLDHFKKQLDEEISSYSKPFFELTDAEEAERKGQKYSIYGCKRAILNDIENIFATTPELQNPPKSDINVVITGIVMSFRDELETLKHEEEELKKEEIKQPGVMSKVSDFFRQTNQDTKQSAINAKKSAINAKKNAINAILKYIEQYRIQLRYIGQINPENAIRYESIVNDAMETLNDNLSQISALSSTQPQWHDALQGILYFLNEVKKVIEGHQQVILETSETELDDFVSTTPPGPQDERERQKRINASKGKLSAGKRKRTGKKRGRKRSGKKRGRTNKKRKCITRRRLHRRH